MTTEHTLERRLRRVEDTLEIQQLPIRYALAVDERDVEGWLKLFPPDVRVGRDVYGRDALRTTIIPMLGKFYRSIHEIVGHRIELVDDEHAVGNVYCRAEHEVGAQWIVMAIRYDDDYQKIDGRWYLSRRRERHWYAADQTDAPQQTDFAGWPTAGRPNLPGSPTWSAFWSGADTSTLTSNPLH